MCMYACMCQSICVAARGQLAGVLFLLPHWVSGIHLTASRLVTRLSSGAISATLWFWEQSGPLGCLMCLQKYSQGSFGLEPWATKHKSNFTIFFLVPISYSQVPWVHFRVYFSVIRKVLSASSSALIQPVSLQFFALSAHYSVILVFQKMPVSTSDLWLFIFRFLAILCLDVFYPTILSDGINCSNSCLPWVNRKSRV